MKLNIKTYKYKIGFTLAEVIITLGIIGIVIALTLTILIQKQIEKQTVTKLKKAYSTLANAYEIAQYEYGDNFRKEINWVTEDARLEFLNKIRPFLDITIDCNNTNAKVCFPKHNDRYGDFYFTYLERKGTTYFKNYKNSAVILKDGTLLIILNSPHSNAGAVQMLIDINGPSKPNHYGHDTFFFYIEDNTKNQLRGKRVIQNSSSCELNSNTQATGCADWILKNDNMDYLHK